MTIVRSAAPRRGADFDDGLMGVALLAGPANVIMELARPGVGYGVLESRVESGRIDRHPIKRARTTFTYLAVATKGTEEQKAGLPHARSIRRMRRCTRRRRAGEVQRVHKDLQLWVAACIYKGAVDVYRMFIGDMDEETAERTIARARARYHAAGAGRDVAGRPRCVRAVLAGVAGQGAHRRRRARVSLADRGRPGPRREAAGSCSAGSTT